MKERKEGRLGKRVTDSGPILNMFWPGQWNIPKPDVCSYNGQEQASVAPCSAQSLARKSCGKVALEHMQW